MTVRVGVKVATSCKLGTGSQPAGFESHALQNIMAISSIGRAAVFDAACLGFESLIASHGRVALTGEQLPCTQTVAGSNPALSTTNKYASVTQLVECLTFNQVVGGSNPPRGTDTYH